MKAGSRHTPESKRRISEGVIASYRKNGKADNGGPDGNVPPALFDSVYDLQRSLFRVVSNVLLSSDMAYRRDRSLQRMMRNDPDVMGPLLQRQMAVALLEWDIVPENEGDDEQVRQAKTIKAMIKKMKRWHDYIRHMQEAVWYGPSAANIIYEKVTSTIPTDSGEGEVVQGIGPVSWFPFHPDSVLFDKDGNVGFRVGSEHPEHKRVISWDGFAHMLSDRERAAFSLHVHNPTGADYDEPLEARYAFSGRGIRDVVWFMWLIKQTALQLWTTYMQRYGMGIREFTYPSGNDVAKDRMETIAKNLISDVTIVRPKDEADLYSLTIHEPNRSSQNVFADLIENYLSGQIKELIIGQSATTEATSTGLGSSVGDQHAKTLGRIVEFDAHNLEDSISNELVRQISIMNFGDTPHMPKFEFSLEDVDSEKWMAGVERAYNMGMKIGERQVRQRLGLDEPEEDEDVLEMEQPQMGGMPGEGGGDTNPFAGLFDDPGSDDEKPNKDNKIAASRSKVFFKEKYDADFESKHPRDDIGRFTDGDGKGGGSDDDGGENITEPPFEWEDLDRQLELIDEWNMEFRPFPSPEVRGAIFDYQGVMFQVVNDDLRDCTNKSVADCLSGDTAERVDEDALDIGGITDASTKTIALQAWLEEQEAVDFATTTLYRGVRAGSAELLDEMDKSLEHGLPVTLNGITSCSLDAAMAWGFTGNTFRNDEPETVVLKFNANKFGYISDLGSSVNEFEQEALFAHGSRFKVKAIHKGVPRPPGTSERRLGDDQTITVYELDQIA